MRYASFTREFVKLAGLDDEPPQQVNRQKMIRALQGAAASAVGAGLGTGLGHLILTKASPNVQNLSPRGRALLVAATAALGGAAGLGAEAIRRRYFDYIDRGA